MHSEWMRHINAQGQCAGAEGGPHVPRQQEWSGAPPCVQGTVARCSHALKRLKCCRVKGERGADPAGSGPRWRAEAWAQSWLPSCLGPSAAKPGTKNSLK